VPGSLPIHPDESAGHPVSTVLEALSYLEHNLVSSANLPVIVESLELLVL